VTPLERRVLIAKLRGRAALDRRRLRALMRRHPGLEVHPSAASAFAVATFHLGAGARVRIGPGVATERRPDAVRIDVRAGGELVVGAGTWLRTELGPVIFHVYEGARLEVGEECLLNGCQLSAKVGVRLGRVAFVGPGTRVFDADQHDLDEARPERRAAIAIGDHTWIASDVTVLRGVEIGDHSVVGAHSLVTHSVPAHSLAYGVPARVRGPVGDRTQLR
jgi:acetyltransferase-like isoleucine patch superfamily enzyme